MSEDAECAEIRDLIPEIAAGGAAGDERARALAHLGDCQECRHELAVTADLVDGMLTLGPAEEPPAGFETRAIARLAPEAKQAKKAKQAKQAKRATQAGRPRWGQAPQRTSPRTSRPSRRSRVAAWTVAIAAAAGLAAGVVWM